MASPLFKFVPDGVNPESGSSTGSKRSLTAESGPGNNHSKRRRNDDNFFGELCEQGLRYAIDRVSYSQNLRHVFNLSAIDEERWICYCDRTGIGRIFHLLDSVNELHRHVLLLKCMKTMSTGEYGVLEQVTKNVGRNAAPGLVPGDDAGANASSSVSKQCVKNANRKGTTLEGLELMTQFSPSTGDRASHFIGRLGQLRSYESLRGVSVIFMARLYRKEVICKLGNCLLVVHVSEDLDDLVKAEIWFRQRLNALKFLGGMENRILRAPESEDLIPFYKLKKQDNSKKYFRVIFQDHHFLWIKGITHRDIGVGDIGGEVYGVLDDWNLSKVEGSKERTSNSRTGTRTFTARELLSEGLSDHKPQGHLERYEWESTFYVLIWIGCRYNAEGKEVNKVAPKKWFTRDLGTLANNKGSICSGSIPFFNEHYDGLTYWIDSIRKLFQAGYNYKRDYLRARRAVERGQPTDFDLSGSFENKTLGDHVTYKKLRKIYRS